MEMAALVLFRGDHKRKDDIRELAIIGYMPV
jgi:hypothetical protein